MRGMAGRTLAVGNVGGKRGTQTPTGPAGFIAAPSPVGALSYPRRVMDITAVAALPWSRWDRAATGIRQRPEVTGVCVRTQLAGAGQSPPPAATP